LLSLAATFSAIAACLERVDEGGGSSSFTPSAEDSTVSRTTGCGTDALGTGRSADGSFAITLGGGADDSSGSSTGSGATKAGALLSRGPAPRWVLPFLLLLLIAPHPIVNPPLL
jgi:hypothetical protein